MLSRRLLSPRAVSATLRNLESLCLNSARLSTAARPALAVPETRITRLDNGFRIASEDSGLPTATVGIWIDAGSRYENDHNNGVAHFLEHMAFKGTKNRNQTSLELEVENMGAHLNAYTSREQTVFYAKCLSSHLERAVELLADILHNSILGEGELERERGVILREMQEVEQNLQEVVFDLMHLAAYGGGPLARTILGPEKNIKSIRRTDLVRYIQEHYVYPRMALCAAGGVDHDHLVELGKQHFGGPVGPKAIAEAPLDSCPFKGGMSIHEDAAMPLMYAALTVEGAGWDSPDNIPLMIGSTLIGQWERSSGAGVSAPNRLADLVTNHIPGAHSYQGFNTCYKDTGLWGVYFVCEEEASEPVVKAVQDIWEEFSETVTETDVERGKRMLSTNMMMMLDGTTPICEDIGRFLFPTFKCTPHGITQTTQSNVPFFVPNYASLFVLLL